MNDITALAQRMKAAAEKATPKDKRCEDVIKWPGFDGQENAENNAEFIAIANPANTKALVEALVEALEKAQQYTKERDEENESLMLTVGRLRTERESLENIRSAAERLVRCKGRYHSEQNYRALAALFGVKTPDLPQLESESRTVTVKLPEEAVDQVCLAAAEIHNLGNGVSDDKAQFIINRIRNYLENGGELTAAGIQVIEGEGQ